MLHVYSWRQSQNTLTIYFVLYESNNCLHITVICNWLVHIWMFICCRIKPNYNICLPLSTFIFPYIGRYTKKKFLSATKFRWFLCLYGNDIIIAMWHSLSTTVKEIGPTNDSVLMELTVHKYTLNYTDTVNIRYSN